jgi:hypothetical protein
MSHMNMTSHLKGEQPFPLIRVGEARSNLAAAYIWPPCLKRLFGVIERLRDRHGRPPDPKSQALSSF